MVAIKLVQTLDVNQKQVINLVVHPNSGAPTPSPIAGQVWYDTATGKFMYRDGVAAADVDMRARAAHTGTQAASTISDLAAVVQAYRLDEFAAPNTALNLNSQNINALLDPTTAQQAATKNYVDTAFAAALAGVSFKAAVRVATTANGALATAFENGDVVDGVTLATGDRILLKNQSAGAENGIYVVNASGAPTRATDADSAAELHGGVIVAVDEGTANNNTAWMLAADVVTLGTTAQSWIQFGAGAIYTASLGVQLVGNDFRANLGPGLTLSGNQIVPDYAETMRRKVAVGFVGTTGTDVAVTHSFALADKSDFLAEVTEHSTGAKVLVPAVGTDVNTVTFSFETAPTTNQYRYQILGLS